MSLDFSIHDKDLQFTTRRLIVRPLKPSDFPAWKTGHLNQVGRRTRFDGPRKPLSELTPKALAKSVKVRRALMKRDVAYIFGIFLKSTGELVGSLDIFVICRLQFQWGNLGYEIFQQHRRRGYAQEASRGAIQFAFETLKLHRIEAAVDPKNRPSEAVAKGIGMLEEGLRRSFCWEDKRWHDLLVYVALPKGRAGRRKPSVRLSIRDML